MKQFVAPTSQTTLHMRSLLRYTVALATILLAANAQIITFAGGEGCAVLTPGPPSDVHAEARNGEVTLKWNPPDNGACVAEYVVDVDAVSDTRYFFDWIPIRTWENELVVSSLDNDVKYKFSIKAVSEELNQISKPAVVYATPRDRCRRVPPGHPTNLRATPGDSEIELCWDGVSNAACVDEFKVDVELWKEDSRFFFDFPQETSKGGCITIQNLENDKEYEFSVQSWSRRFQRGGVAKIVASPETKWRCKRISNWYKPCEAAAFGRCRALSCRDQAHKGACDAPWMQEVDWKSKTITQYCADYCACPNEPPNAGGTRIFLLDDHCCENRRRSISDWVSDILD